MIFQLYFGREFSTFQAVLPICCRNGTLSSSQSATDVICDNEDAQDDEDGPVCIQMLTIGSASSVAIGGNVC